MELFNLLDAGLPVLGQTYDVSLNWIGQLIRWLCNGVGVVGVGIILFSLILKLITLPFDIYQRISMRKQNIQMKANQEKMEKLQKQYANDKDKYNQKVMEMYKENGISMFSSCLPMILSLVIFIVAINAFNAYAQYSNVENYNTLVKAYNAEMKSHCAQLTEENFDTLVTSAENGDEIVYTVSDPSEIVYYTAKVAKANIPESATNADKVKLIDGADKNYFVSEDRANALPEIQTFLAENADKTVVDYLYSKAQDAVVLSYENEVKNKTSFVWIKNIWVTDASYKNPVLSATDFKTEAQREEFEVNGKDVEYGDVHKYTNAYTDDSYNTVTAKLTAQKSAANGYFVLIALSIGTILLQQFVTMRSQKEQQKYSSVDGMAGSQQKMTMVIMTVMFAVFSFMYSSAFSIYMITSNLFSLLSTVVINKFVDKKMEKVETEKSVARMQNTTADRIEKAKNAGKASANESKKKNNIIFCPYCGSSNQAKDLKCRQCGGDLHQKEKNQ